jgi:SAM-dependent methyltransferase
VSLEELCASVWALSALRVAAECELLTAMASGATLPSRLAKAVGLDPTVTQRVLETLEVNGFAVRDGDAFVLSAEGADLAQRNDWLRVDLAATFGQTRAFVLAGRTSDLAGGWQHTDPEVIRAQGMLSEITGSRSIAAIQRAAPDMERLSRPGAAVLDVGSGAAGGLIAFCRRFPLLRGVGIEPLRAARLEARAAILAAGLGDRIEIVACRGEELEDQAVYDAAFVATPFIEDGALRPTLERVNRALIPGGRVILIATQPPNDARIAAAARLRWQLWGGGTRTAAETVRIATDAGLVDLRAGVASANLVPIVGRAPPATA